MGELLTRIRREGLGGGRDSSDSNAESSRTLVPEFKIYSVIATAKLVLVKLLSDVIPPHQSH